MPKLSDAGQAAIDDISHRVLKVKTLEVRDCDRLGFHELSVWSIRIALETACLCGMVDRFREG